MTKPQGFLATFRIDEELWGKFKDIAKNKQTNASALIIQYIQGVVSSGGVDNSPKATPQNIDSSPQPNLDDIYKYIDDKLDNNTAVSPQPNLDDIYKYIDDKLDNLEDVSIQDIDNKIAESLRDGDIKDAISNSYAAVMGQFNGLLEELQALQKQLQELKSVPPAPQLPTAEGLTTDNEELTTDNYQLPEQETGNREQGTGEYEDQVDSDLTSDTQSPIINDQLPITSHSERKPNFTRNYQIVSMLECQFWIDGKRFNQQDLKDNGIDKSITRNKAEIESILETEINTKNSVIQRFVGILRAMGFEVEGGLKDGYYIANPEIFN
jgi:hypothetical protein